MKKLLTLIIFLWVANFSYAIYYPTVSDLNKINEQTNKFVELIDTWKITKEELLEQLFAASYDSSLSEKNKYVVNVVINNLLKYNWVDSKVIDEKLISQNNIEKVHWAATQELNFTNWMDFNSIDKASLYAKIIPYIRNNIAVRENNWARMVAYNVIWKESFLWYAKLYVWWVAQEYYKKDGQILKWSLVSSPMALYVKIENNDFVIYHHDMPKDWDSYEIWYNKMFPQVLLWIIEERLFLNDLFISVDNQSINYFASN